MVCLDASVFIAWLLPEEFSNQAEALLKDLKAKRETCVAPNLMVAEVASSLRNAVYSARVPSAQGEEALASFMMYEAELQDVRRLTDSAWTWGTSLNAPRLYDMYYVALAERENCDLWTVDRRLVNLVGRKSSRVRWVGDFDDDHQPA